MKNLLSLFLVFFSLSSFAHPLHLSLTNMDVKGDSLLFSIKIFEDDFTDVLKSQGIQNINFSPINSSTSEAILKYLNENLVIHINEKALNYSIDKAESKDLAVWITLSSPLDEPIQSLLVKNSVMLDWFNDQKNLLIVNYMGKDQGYQFDNRTSKLEIPLKK